MPPRACCIAQAIASAQNEVPVPIANERERCVSASKTALNARPRSRSRRSFLNVASSISSAARCVSRVERAEALPALPGFFPLAIAITRSPEAEEQLLEPVRVSSRPATHRPDHTDATNTDTHAHRQADRSERGPRTPELTCWSAEALQARSGTSPALSEPECNSASNRWMERFTGFQTIDTDS
jgi:hypothetical protein